ncbi:hypothetical protein FOVSG1_003497 [Fusarium oxysporum f. sp. vasinfectum]
MCPALVKEQGYQSIATDVDLDFDIKTWYLFHAAYVGDDSILSTRNPSSLFEKTVSLIHSNYQNVNFNTNARVAPRAINLGPSRIHCHERRKALLNLPRQTVVVNPALPSLEDGTS